ncbi:hypothetical protein TWF506_003798 [Arthrobotrys conoides]|uniref:G domain-containing protein n=1 Tax=Arthrobotrys conoides TaxID=74498 RepID=A0AAN8N2U9_9PEZI
MSTTLRRPALGHTAALGDLYDARSDTFISLSLLKDPPPENAIVRTDNHRSDIKVSKSETYREKLKNFNLSAELSASFLAGMVAVGGSGSYLNDIRESNRVMETSLHYNIDTIHEKLNFSASGMNDSLAHEALSTKFATHVVTEVNWGAQTIVTARYTLAESATEDRCNIEGRFALGFKKLSVNIASTGTINHADTDNTTEEGFQVVVHGDILADDSILPTDFASACQFIKNVPRYIKSANGGKGKALVYTLIPISWLKSAYKTENMTDEIIRQLDNECLERFTDLFDDIHNVQQILNDYHAYLNLYNRSSYIPDYHLDEVVVAKRGVRARAAKLRSEYAKVLKDVRTGKADSQKLWDLYDQFDKGDFTVKSLDAVTKKYSAHLRLIDDIMALGAHYLGYNCLPIATELAKIQHENTYIFYFNKSVREESLSWADNIKLLYNILRDTEKEKMVLVVDCDAQSIPLEKPRISQYRCQQIVVEDVLERHVLLQKLCVAKYNLENFDRIKTLNPRTLKSVKIPCPGIFCDSSLSCEWVCFHCQAPIKYCHSDNYIYCECGRGQYMDYSFRCNNLKHRSSFTAYIPERLFALLKASEPLQGFDKSPGNTKANQELNILILDEKGAGKSTFINALYNYLLFDGLPDAMGTDPINYLFPFSFAMQLPDTSDPSEPLVQKEIKVMTQEDEEDITGEPGTKKIEEYSFHLGDVNVRLLDPPEFGNPHGVDQEEKNMAGVLSSLTDYSKLHGILILLNPNSSKLSPTFETLMNELLAGFHRSATKNVVFGFTNTRDFNYQPGCAFMPLKEFFGKDEERQIRLHKSNIYCLEMSSFRYLAAHKRGVELEGRDEYCDSWRRSVTESRRLMRHFLSLEPHDVEESSNFDKNRHLISQLSEPMVKVSYIIKTRISKLCKQNPLESDSDEDYSDTESDEDVSERKERTTTRSTLEEKKKRRILDLKDEHKNVQEIAAHFCVYLKENSFTPWRDTTLEFHNSVIRSLELVGFVELMGFRLKKDVLESLKEDRAQYQSLVEEMMLNLKQGKGYRVLDGGEIAKKVEGIYAMSYYGRWIRLAVRMEDSTDSESGNIWRMFRDIDRMWH